MRRSILASVFLSAAAIWVHPLPTVPRVGGEQSGGARGEPAQPQRTHQVALNGHTFTLPAGFEIDVAAGPPLIDRPITIDFDEQGRLYAADSSGSNDKVQEQLEKKPHRIVRLEDTDGDGCFDKSVVFADKMMFPEGTMWFAGSLYVAAPPSIWKLTDKDGDGVADERIEWFQGKTLTGCANDLHGPYLGPDGWIYWCKGAFAKQTYERPPGRPGPFVTRASHIFRCRPDGSGIEPVMTGGMDNPVDTVFTPGGERIFTTTFFQQPGGGRRDGIIHAVYGGIYGKDHDVLYDPAHKWTGPSLMPVLAHHGPAASCGLARYESQAFGPEYQHNLFAALFNMQKITRHILTPDGATFKSRDEDFLVSNNRDFHPTDVLEDADGSLLVVDTGGWFKLCCPTSQLHKPDVLGAIYRVRRKSASRVDDPRGLKLAWSKLTARELADLLDDARPVVRRRAIEALAAKGPDAMRELARILTARPSAEARRNAVWAATRIDHASARSVVRAVLADADETVRQAAIHSVSVWRDGAAVPTLLQHQLRHGLETVPQLREIMPQPSPHNQRAAAEALGRIGDKSAVPALLEAIGKTDDRVLEHSLIYALIEIADREGSAAGLKNNNPRIHRAAMIALDQMDGGKLEPETVARQLTSADPAMKETAWWIVSRHAEWGEALTGVIRDRLAAKNLPDAEREELARQLARFARTPAIQELLVGRLTDPSASPEARQIVLRAMGQSRLKEAPASWIDALTRILAGGNTDLLREAVAAAQALSIPKQKAGELGGALLKVAKNAEAPVNVRLGALAAVPGGWMDADPSLFAFVRGQLTPDQPVGTRALAAEVFSRAKLNSEQLLALTESIKTVGPMELDRLMEPFAQSADEKVGRSLVVALKASTSKSSLRVDVLKRCLAKYGPPVQQQAEELYAALDVDAAKQKVQLEQLLTSLKDGDVRRGQAVFNSTKAACASCHAIGYLGGKIGPDLTHIGKIRNERDLLESIVFPNASFVRSYESVLVATKGGKVLNGVVRKDAPDEVILVMGADQEVRIPRGDIDEMQPSKVSIMPAGLDQQLTPQDLADLVAFLKACK